jgi:hypothetical protein
MTQSLSSTYRVPIAIGRQKTWHPDTDAKNRAMLRSFRLVQGQSSDLSFLLQPAFTQQHKRPLLPGRYASCDQKIGTRAIT